MEYGRQYQNDDHKDCLRGTSDIILCVSDQEKESDESNLEDVDAGEKLRKSIVEEQSMGIDFVSLYVIVIVSVSQPEKAERERHEDEHQRRDDTVDEADDGKVSGQ